MIFHSRLKYLTRKWIVEKRESKTCYRFFGNNYFRIIVELFEFTLVNDHPSIECSNEKPFARSDEFNASDYFAVFKSRLNVRFSNDALRHNIPKTDDTVNAARREECWMLGMKADALNKLIIGGLCCQNHLYSFWMFQCQNRLQLAHVPQTHRAIARST